jgi:translation elongation factor EF-4
MEVFNQRLKDEFDMDIVMTTPSVPYILEFDEDVRRGLEKSSVTVSCVSQWPVSIGSKHSSPSFTVLEPIVKVG